MTANSNLADQFRNLIAFLKRAPLDPPADLSAALTEMPPAGHLPPPGWVWLFFHLVTYGCQRRALRRLVECELEFRAPDLPGWKVDVYHEEILLQTRADSQVLYFVPTGRTQFALPDFRGYLHVRRDHPTVARLAEFPEFALLDPPAVRLWMGKDIQDLKMQQELIDPEPGDYAIREMGQLGLVLIDEEHTDFLVFRLPRSVARLAGAIRAICRLWSQLEARPWVAAVIGDWEAAHAAAQTLHRPELVALTQMRAEQSRTQRLAQIQERICTVGPTAPLLHALDDLGVEGLPGWAAGALRGPIPAAQWAMVLISELDDTTWCPDVLSLFRRVGPGGADPEADLALTCAEFLATHGHLTSEVVDVLSQPGICDVTAALFAYKFAPDRLLPLVPSGLRNEWHPNYAVIAALLALIDEPWAYLELLDALRDTSEPSRAAVYRAALRRSSDSTTRKETKETGPPAALDTSRTLAAEAGRTIAAELGWLRRRLGGLDKVPAIVPAGV